jgi:SPP1 gp7 family putative phage head morphogenesis protein
MASRDLYDASVRLQLLIEAVKVNFQLLFNPVFAELSEQINALVYAVKTESLDSLTKRELELLVGKIHKLQISVYAGYVGALNDEMRDFAEALGEVLTAVYEVEPKKAPRIWSAIQSEPIGANGVFVGVFVKSFAATGTVQIENMIRKAYANAKTKHQTVQDIEATLNKIRFQSNAVTNTNIQHIASMVSQSYAVGKFGRYRWISVIDSATTDVCHSRNNKMFKYGEGPLPPAHINCRSLITPHEEGQNSRAETFFSFLSRQGNAIQNIALGTKTAGMLRANRVKAADLMKLANPMRLTTSDFRNSVDLIIDGD